MVIFENVQQLYYERNLSDILSLTIPSNCQWNVAGISQIYHFVLQAGDGWGFRGVQCYEL